MRTPARAVQSALLLAMVGTALTTAAQDATAASAYGRPAGTGAWTARLVAETRVAAAPGGAWLETLDPFTPATGSSVTLLVLGSAQRRGAVWLRVRLPERPNDASAWIRRNDVMLARTPYRIVISTRHRSLTLVRAGRTVLRTRVVVGTAATPTPQGLFALYDAVPVPSSAFAPYELQLTAHSDVLRTFAGGDGRVAFHGMNGALRVPLGTARSHGCVRLLPAHALSLARAVPLGSPVVIGP